jgi:hypothetical protein
LDLETSEDIVKEENVERNVEDYVKIEYNNPKKSPSDFRLTTNTPVHHTPDRTSLFDG